MEPTASTKPPLCMCITILDKDGAFLPDAICGPTTDDDPGDSTLSCAAHRCIAFDQRTQCPKPRVGDTLYCEDHQPVTNPPPWDDAMAFYVVSKQYRQDLREFWTRSDFLLIAQSALLAGFTAFHALQNAGLDDYFPCTIIAVVDIILALTWRCILTLSHAWIMKWRWETVHIDVAVIRFRRYSDEPRDHHGPDHVTHATPRFKYPAKLLEREQARGGSRDVCIRILRWLTLDWLDSGAGIASQLPYVFSLRLEFLGCCSHRQSLR